MTDHIEILGLRAFGHHGVLDHERADGQWFVVDVQLDLDLRPAADSDDVADTVDYGLLAERLHESVSATRYDLLEALADHLAQRCLSDQRVRRARVRVAKPDAPMPVGVQEVAVVVERPPTDAGSHPPERGVRR